jgi:hypothetical protein
MSNTVKTRIEELQLKAETSLEKFFQYADDLLTKSTTRNRDIIEKETGTALHLYEEYFKLLKGTKHEDLKNAIIGYENIVNAYITNPDLSNFKTDLQEYANQILVSTQMIRIEFNNLVRAVNPSSLSGLQQSHQDFSVMSQHLFIVYTFLEKLKRQGKAFTRVASIGQGRTADGRGGIMSLPRLGALSETYRALYTVAIAITRSNLVKNSKNLVTLTDVTQEYFDTVDQYEHLLIKEKLIDVLSGQASQDLVLEDQSKKSKLESRLGKLISSSDLRKSAQIDGSNLLTFLTQFINDFANIEGSKPMQSEIVNQLTQVAVGKKPKAYKATTRKRKRTKAKIKNPIAKSAVALASAKVGLRMPVIPPRKVSKKTRESGGSQREINKLRLQINRRLPAEVRRNMGRPALINQTGRFSNSVELSELRQGPKTLIGEYRYQFDPYETFENQGPKRWPTGYNPKPLITKSIRNLAAQYTEQKFTLRRE